MAVSTCTTSTDTQAAASLECDWSQHICPDGFKYYYNCVTCESMVSKISRKICGSGLFHFSIILAIFLHIKFLQKPDFSGRNQKSLRDMNKSKKNSEVLHDMLIHSQQLPLLKDRLFKNICKFGILISIR